MVWHVLRTTALSKEEAAEVVRRFYNETPPDD
jgi:hypothetical protein